jgi:Putative DnaT-like ssDNA binding protein
MALIVEDGTGLATAESFASRDEATAFQRGRADDTTWLDANVDAQEAALKEATTYLDGNFDWVGSVSSLTQALGWPRAYVIDAEGRSVASDAVPQKVKDACCFLAAKAIVGALQPELAGATVTSKRVASIAVTYSTGGDPAKRSFPEVRAMLKGLFNGSSGSGVSGSVTRWS